jgi:alpha-D-ribose 1-methylphosphonate 5-triphosphate diphosphatase PhnM
LQNPGQRNINNLNNVRSEIYRTFRNKKMEYTKEKINELETNRTKISETYIEA